MASKMGCACSTAPADPPTTEDLSASQHSLHPSNAKPVVDSDIAAATDRAEEEAAPPADLPMPPQGKGNEVGHEAVHGPDGRTLPLDGITIEALEHIAADSRLTDQTTTEQACQHILMAAGMPAGWTDVVRSVPGTPYSNHSYRNDKTGAIQETPPAGTRAIALVLRESPHLDTRATVGDSNRFISHYWQLHFRSVISAVRRTVAKERADGKTEEIYLWFDVISIDQHNASKYAKGFSTTFMHAVGQIGHLYLIGEPWSGPSVLTRSWCLWELFCCHEMEAKLSVCFDQESEMSFMNALSEDGTQAMNLIFKNVDSSKAQATREKDTNKIAAEIKHQVGFLQLDSIVTEQLREWLASTAAQTLECMPAANRSLRLVSDLGMLYKNLGKFDKAQLLLLEAVDAHQSNLGAQHSDTAASLLNLGILYQDQGKLDEAEPLMRQALDVFSAIYGDRHPNALTAMGNLGSLFRDQGRLEQAEALLEELIDARCITLGHHHVATLSSISNLAQVSKAQRKVAKAEKLLLQVLDAHRAMNGDRHPETLVTIANLSALYQDIGNLDQAEPLLTESVNTMRATLGKQHPDTLRSISNLGNLYQNQGKLDQAEPLMLEVLDAMRAALGDQHPNTVVSIANLGALHSAQGKLTQAEPLLVEALAARRTSLGDLHPDTLISIYNLSGVYKVQGKLGQAEPLMVEDLSAMRASLGNRHPDTLQGIDDLANVYRAQGKLVQAEPLMTEALDAKRAALGDRHHETLVAVGNMIDLLREASKFEQARSILGDTAAIASEVLGLQHVDTMVIRAKVARLQYMQPSGALEGKAKLQTIVEQMTETLGTMHPQTVKYATVWRSMTDA